MAISSVGSNARPGVCTSTTRPTAPFEGQLIYETDTNRVLIWEGAAWVMVADTDQPPALQLITPTISGTGISLSGSQVVLTNATSVELRSIFTEEFDNYRLMFHVTGNTNGSSLQMRMLSGTNTEETGSIYRRMGVGWYAGGSYTDANNNATEFNIGNQGSGQAGSIYHTIDIIGPNTTRRTWISGDFGMEWISNDIYMIRWACEVDSATQYTGIRLVSSSTQFSGVVSVYGYRK